MKGLVCITLVFGAVIQVTGQSTKTAIRNANKLYHAKQYKESVAVYDNARTPDGMDPVASYNKGNAQLRDNNIDASIETYDKTIDKAKNQGVREKSYYNKGVAFSKQQKLGESIDAWKNALKIDPADQEARENLQKALAQQKEQEEKNKDQKKDQQEKKDKKQQDKPQPQQNQSKLTKQQVEQLLKALQQKEKEIQQRLQKSNSSPTSPEKDW